MTITKYEQLNRTLAIIDACQVDCEIDFSFILSADIFDLTNPDNKKGHSISKYVNKDFLFKLTQDNKQTLIKDLAENFCDGEICHYIFIKDSKKIGQGFDHCEINSLNPFFFKLTSQHLEILNDVEIYFNIQID